MRGGASSPCPCVPFPPRAAAAHALTLPHPPPSAITQVVYNLLDQMVAVKLNVLHLHASDECRWSVESKLYPNLTASLAGVLGGFYTQEDIKAMVAYAAARGIRVVPEFDIPSHSRGLRPIKGEGVVFCDDGDTQSQVYGDPANSTLGVLKALFAEMAGLFSDEVFHIGADETSADGPCTVESTFQLERTVLNYLEGSLGKTAAGWEEVLFDASAATNKTVVYAWSRHTPQEIIDLGRRAVDSVSSDFYMTSPAAPYPGGWKSFWYDITTGMRPDSVPSLLGGEMSMWTDTYCFSAQCGAYHGGTPVGAPLFPPEMDAPWGKSVGGMMFPRGYVGASSFWNYNASQDSQSPDFVAAVWDLNDRMVTAGALTCPTKCQCDQLTACGAPYVPPTPPTPPAANMSVGVAPCALPLSPLQSFALGAGGVLAATGAGGAGLCVANPAGGSGNPTYPLRLAQAGSADCVAWARGVAGRLVDGASGGCLDLSADGVAGIYECGSGSGFFQENQAWAADAALGAVVTLKDGSCLTAAAA